MIWRDRVKEMKRVKSSELLANPRNWREHPADQKSAMQGVLDEIGIAGALIARETDEGLELIDGHLRTEMMDSDTEWPVLVLDVNKEEADTLLATIDPIAAMANRNNENLADLLAGIETETEELSALLDNLRGELPIDVEGGRTVDSPLSEWYGMPEFDQPDATGERKLIVNFVTEQDFLDFMVIIDRKKYTDKTKSIWYPEEERLAVKDMAWEGSESDDDE